jgi:hypothetical protein
VFNAFPSFASFSRSSWISEERSLGKFQVMLPKIQ